MLSESPKVLLFFKERLFLIFLLFFLALRLTMLLTCIGCVSQDDEVYEGTIAKELIEGLKVSLWDYQPNPYTAGAIIMGIIAVPFFLLLGPNFFALKLAPLSLSLATLLLSYLFFKRFFDRKTALHVTALLTLPLPIFTALSLAAGGHLDPAFFSAAMLFFFYNYLYEERRKKANLFLLGGIAGLGCWLTPLNFITLFVFVVSWFVLDRRSFLSGRLLLFGGAFLAGIFPMFVYNWTHQFEGLEFMARVFLPEAGGPSSFFQNLQAFPMRFLTLISRILPLSFAFLPFLKISGSFLTLMYGLVTILLIVPFYWQKLWQLFPILLSSLRYGKIMPHQLGPAKFLPFLLYPPSFVFLYSLSNISFPFPTPFHFSDFRYFVSFYYFTFSLIALSLRSKKGAIFFATIILSLGLMGQAPLLFQEPIGRAFYYQGYSYWGLGETWGRYYSFPKGLAGFNRLADHFRDPERRYLYWGLSSRMDLRKEENPGRMIESIRRVPPPYRHYFSEGWGRLLSTRRSSDLNQIDTFAQLIPEEEKPYFFYGLATKIPLGFPNQSAKSYLRSIREPNTPYALPFYSERGRLFFRYFKQHAGKESRIELPGSLGAEEKAWVYRGIGQEAALWWMSLRFFRAIDPIRAKVPSEYQSEFFWGIGWGLRAQMDTIEDRRRALDWFERLPDEIRPSAWKGFLACEKWYRISPSESA